MIIPAENKDLDAVLNITHTTIKTVYPNYYPQGAVEFFLNHHSKTSIKRDISDKKVFLSLSKNNELTGTVTVSENELNRLFVLPQYQGNGYGSELMKFAENYIFSQHSTISLSASFPAKAIYLAKGYQPVEYHTIKTENGDFLCYDVMVKYLSNL